MVGQRRHRAGDPGAVARVVRRPDRDPGQRQALGVDQLEGTGVLRGGGDVGGHAQRDQAVRALEAGEAEGAVREQLEVVELARASGSAAARRAGRTQGKDAPRGVRGGWLGSSACLRLSSSPRSSAPGSWRATTTARWSPSTPTASVGLVGRRRRARRSCRGRATSRSRRSACCAPASTSTASCSRWRARRTPGEPFHLEGVRRILAAAGLDESALQTPPDYPLDDAGPRGATSAPAATKSVDRDELLRQARGDARDLRRQRLGHRDLPRPRAPAPGRRSPTTFAELTGEPVEAVAVDGCGAPLLSTSLTGLARAFRTLATADRRAREAGRRRDPDATPSSRPARRRDEARAAARRARRDRQGRGGVLLRGGAAPTAARSRSRPTTAPPGCARC